MKRLRKFKPFGAAPPYNPATGRFLALGDTRAFVDLEVVEVGHDALLCVAPDQRQALVAKPWAFRRSEFSVEDGLDGIVYASSTVGQRTATVDGVTYTQTITPDYYEGEKIVAMRKEKDERVEVEIEDGELSEVQQGDYTLDFEDLNTAGRRWETAKLRVKITAIGDNTLTVKQLEEVTAGGEGLDYATGATEFTVWKPWELQKQAYHGLTIDSVAYSYVAAQERTSTLSGNTETEIVIPRYYVGAVLVVAQLPGGYCPGGPIGRMFDTNEARRSWALEYTA